jgi:hypothetical protein
MDLLKLKDLEEGDKFTLVATGRSWEVLRRGETDSGRRYIHVYNGRLTKSITPSHPWWSLEVQRETTD